MMRLSRLTLVLLGIAPVALAAAFFLGSAAEEPARGLVVFTEVPVDEATAGARYPEASRLAAVDPEAPGAPRVLTPGFAAARAPDVSYDGRRIVFAGRRAPDDPWEIWEMPAAGGEARRLTTGLEGCTDPAYLPDDRIAFSALAPVRADAPGGDRALALFTMGRDGCCLERISFHPDTDYAAVGLRDSRVLFAAEHDGATEYLAMRYDGTGAELYYESARGRWLARRPRPSADGRLVFVETAGPEAAAGRLVAVRDARPLHSHHDLAPGREGFHSVFPAEDGRWLVSYREAGEAPFAVFAFDPRAGALGTRLGGSEGYHAVEPVLAVPRYEPDGFLSIVDTTALPAELFSLDVDLSTLPVHPGAGRSTALRVLGVDGSLGEVPVHEDGSVRVEVPHDTPLRFETVDAAGRVVRGPSAWVWVRPNERRGCVGCHEDRERVPDNTLKKAYDEPAVVLAPARPDGAATYEVD